MILPEKVEGKLFIVTLLICLLASFITSQYILSTEHDRLVIETKMRLETVSTRQGFEILNQVNEHLRQCEQMAREIGSAMTSTGTALPLRFSEDPSGVRLGVSPGLAASFYLPAGLEITDSMEGTIGRIQEAIDILSPTMLSEFVGVTVVTTDDYVISSPPSLTQLLPQGYSPSTDPMLQEARSYFQSFWTPVRYEPTTRSWLSTLVVPIRIEGEFKGMISCDYRLDRMFSDISSLAAMENGGAFIIQGEDTILAHSLIPSLIQKNRGVYGSFRASEIQDLNLQRVVNAYTETRANAGRGELNRSGYTYELNDVEHFSYVYPVGVSGWDWSLAVYTDSSRIDTYIASLGWKALFSSMMLALLFMFLIRDVFQRLFLKRIIALEKATRDYADTEAFVIPNPGKDEIGQLAFSFQELVHSLETGKIRLTEQALQLESEILERQAAVDSLEESEDKFKALFENSPDAILLLDETLCIDCNAAAVQLFRFSDKTELMERGITNSAPVFQPDGQTSRDKWDAHVKDAHTYGKYNFEWVIQTEDDRSIWVDVLLTEIPYQGSKVLYAVIRDIGERKRQEMERVRLTTAIEQAAESIMVTATTGKILYVNPAFLKQNQYERDAILGQNTTILMGENPKSITLSDILDSVLRGVIWKGRMIFKKSDGIEYKAESTISPVRDASGSIMNFVYVSRDVTKEVLLESQLRQAQKMEAIGELASGIAHEINTPTQYIGDNIRFFRDSFDDITNLLEKFKTLLDPQQPDESFENDRKDIRKFIEEIDLTFLEEEIPTAIEQSLDGNRRVAEIVRAMKEFSHPGAEERSAVDVNHSIRNTMSVARNEWKYVADIETNLADDLPLVPCFPGSFNQVILNLFVNAAHAIADVVKDGAQGKGTITVSTGVVDDFVEVRISDTGCGIPETLRTKIFDPFFTTKEVGKGTGQGLSLAHSVIVEKHNGTIDFESVVGLGTTFIVRIPLTFEEESD